MKILFFRESEIKELNPDIAEKIALGATETCFILLAKELAQKNIVKVCCPCSEKKFYDSVEYIPATKTYSALQNTIYNFKPDVLIVVANPSVLFKDLKLEKTKAVFWQHNHPLEMKMFPIGNLLDRGINVVLPSPEAAEYTKKFYNNQNILGIYNGVRNGFFEVKNNGFDNRIIYVGALTKAKGVAELLKVVSNLPDFSFFICGSFDMHGTKEEDYYQECIKLSEKNPHVIFLGGLNRSQLIEQMKLSQLCIVNPKINNREVCCVNALESMAIGTPILAGGRSIIDPIISHGGISYIDNIEQAIRQLMNDKELRNELGKSGSEWVKNLTWENISIRWETFLREKICV